MKQKLGIAEAFLGGYPLIVLDEPTNALDHDSIIKLIALIQRFNANGSTFVIASHDHEFVEQVAAQKLSVKEGRSSMKVKPKFWMISGCLVVLLGIIGVLRYQQVNTNPQQRGVIKEVLIKKANLFMLKMSTLRLVKFRF